MSAVNHIAIAFKPDRSIPGILEARDAGGAILFSCPCLGRSAGSDKGINPDRDPAYRYGHTPAGVFMPTYISHSGEHLPGYGGYFILLVPAAGQALKRRGALSIHGGRGNGPLKATFGTVRVRDRDMAALAKICGESLFTVSIREEA